MTCNNNKTSEGQIDSKLGDWQVQRNPGGFTLMKQHETLVINIGKLAAALDYTE